MPPAEPSSVPPAEPSTTGEVVARIGSLMAEVRLEVGAPREAIPSKHDVSLAWPGQGEGSRVAAGLELARGRTGVADRRVLAAYLQGWYAWFVLAPTLMAYQGLGRVVALPVEETRLAWDGSSPPTLWLSPRLRAGSGEAAGRHELRQHLHDEIVAHMGAVITILNRESGLGVRMQWLQTSDVISSLLQWVGERLGDEREGIAEAERLTSLPGSPLRSPRGRFATWRHGDVERTLFHRASCCLWWRSGEDAYCMTCPLLDEAGQAQRIDVWLADLA